jgi:hypothetical protein
MTDMSKRFAALDDIEEKLQETKAPGSATLVSKRLLENWKEALENSVPVSILNEDSELVAVKADRYRQAINLVCEGFTLPDGARKILEKALWG